MYALLATLFAAKTGAIPSSAATGAVAIAFISSIGVVKGYIGLQIIWTFARCTFDLLRLLSGHRLLVCALAAIAAWAYDQEDADESWVAAVAATVLVLCYICCVAIWSAVCTCKRCCRAAPPIETRITELGKLGIVFCRGVVPLTVRHVRPCSAAERAGVRRGMILDGANLLDLSHVDSYERGRTLVRQADASRQQTGASLTLRWLPPTKASMKAAQQQTPQQQTPPLAANTRNSPPRARTDQDSMLVRNAALGGKELVQVTFTESGKLGLVWCPAVTPLTLADVRPGSHAWMKQLATQGALRLYAVRAGDAPTLEVRGEYKDALAMLKRCARPITLFFEPPTQNSTAQAMAVRAARAEVLMARARQAELAREVRPRLSPIGEDAVGTAGFGSVGAGQGADTIHDEVGQFMQQQLCFDSTWGDMPIPGLTRQDERLMCAYYHGDKPSVPETPSNVREGVQEGVQEDACAAEVAAPYGVCNAAQLLGLYLRMNGDRAAMRRVLTEQIGLSHAAAGRALDVLRAKASSFVQEHVDGAAPPMPSPGKNGHTTAVFAAFGTTQMSWGDTFTSNRVPAVGTKTAAKLCARDVSNGAQLVGQFMLLNGDEDEFLLWCTEVVGIRTQEVLMHKKGVGVGIVAAVCEKAAQFCY